MAQFCVQLKVRTICVLRMIFIVTVFSSAITAESQQLPAATDNAFYRHCMPTSAGCTETWIGARTAAGRSQALLLHVVRLRDGDKATVDLPDFGALDVPASNLAASKGALHFELAGDSSSAIFDGIVSGDSIHGSWKEAEQAGEFALKYAPETREPFRAVPVSFNNGDVRLHGTLLLPLQSIPVPAIVFVQGAGPEQRYASRFLAEFFAKQGVATLIYDKRGAGQSSGDWKHSSFQDLAGDVMASVTLLKTRSEIDPRRIGLMGSSQGGWVAPLAATQTPGIAFVVVKSAAAVTPEAQELARVETQMLAERESPAEISEALRLYKNAIAYARSGEGWESLKTEIVSDANKKWAFFDPDTPKDYWFFDQIRLSFEYDPVPVLKQLKPPLLVIFGGKDDDGPALPTQLGALLQAMQGGGKRSELAIFPNADHTLRVHPGKGEPWDFGRFAPGYLDTLAAWVKTQTLR